MKLATHPATWSHVSWPSPTMDEGSLRPESSSAVKASCETGGARPARSGNLSASLRIVRILAFCQAIIFIVLFLFVCAWAGATTTDKSTVDLQMISSSYSPKKDRSPFGAGPVQAVDTSAKVEHVIAPGLFKLSGILYDPVHPSAVVNGQLVELKKTVKIPTDQGEMEVKASQIAREFIRLEVGSQKLELWLSGHEPDKQTK